MKMSPFASQVTSVTCRKTPSCAGSGGFDCLSGYCWPSAPNTDDAGPIDDTGTTPIEDASTGEPLVPDSGTTTDPGLAVDFGKAACLKFSKAGTFGFLCTAHGFKGSIVVQ